MRRNLTEALRRNGYGNGRKQLPDVPRELVLPGIGTAQWWSASSVDAQHFYVLAGEAWRIYFRKGRPVAYGPPASWRGSTPLPSAA